MLTVAPQRYRADVLRALCVAGPSAVEAVARRSGIKTGIVHGELLAAEAVGLVVHCPATGRWSSSAAGRVMTKRLVSGEVDPGARTGLGSLARRLADLDREVAVLMSRWFLREGETDGEHGTVTINDHTDPIHDAAVLEEVSRSHPDRISAIYAAVVIVPRLERYAGRLADAWRRVRLGDHAALGDPDCDPYFDVWAEFLRDVHTLAH
ncbi:hypothetical protein LWC33_15695 [Pseudonocardia sp. RS11V-5]|uniref:hypothetical protein n=1 Tax=Pseudonocardia terrae TaxID=2905831 RepID=UPI001E639CE4|nr:hypothetical protein [Pseudonocardia terrae]MCE3552896.1 hypothetical protein [Pseudonocardia terrae]